MFLDICLPGITVKEHASSASQTFQETLGGITAIDGHKGYILKWAYELYTIGNIKGDTRSLD